MTEFRQSGRFTTSMANPPKSVKTFKDRGVMELVWSDDTVSSMPFKFIRGECPCAVCVDEFTGRRLIDVTKIPADIAPTALSYTGNYAMKIVWSDGHDTGLYTWDRLQILCTEFARANKS